MRVWDVPVDQLCRSHLLGQHNEIHGLWTVIIEDRSGYSKHPETSRWRGKLPALRAAHDVTAAEMKRRGYRHVSPLPLDPIAGESAQTEYVESLESQMDRLRQKSCGCRV